MTPPAAETKISLHEIPFAEGGFLILERALRQIKPGSFVTVESAEDNFALHLGAWCRQKGCNFEITAPGIARVERPRHFGVHLETARRAGSANTPQPEAEQAWGLAARGAAVEQGIEGFSFALNQGDHIWTSRLAALYRRAAAAQWNPETAIDWHQPIDNPPEIEAAIVQVMTYLIENETVALIIPTRFAAQVHPHYYEVMQLLAIQAADEARHIEVFTRRASLRTSALGFSSAGGQASLKTLLSETDFSLAALLLSVLGEGSFLSLLHFLQVFAPDRLTRQICALAAKDEARHVVFAMTHLRAAVAQDGQLTGRFAAAIEKRHAELTQTAGLNDEVFHALVLLSAGSTANADIATGYQAVKRLERHMYRGRVRRLQQLGFDTARARALSELHTRNFM